MHLLPSSFWTINRLTFLAAMSVITACGSGGSLPSELAYLAEELPEVIDYNFDVKPILSDRCFNCHGPDEQNRQADLRLDIAEEAYAALENSNGKRAIIPHDANGSEMTARLLSDNAELVMPPPESKLTITDKEKAILVKWINQGAEYKPHWSFQPRKDVKVGGEGNPVDFFVRNALQVRSLDFSPEADKETLIRRAYFDLLGVPPTLEEVDAFMAATDSGAYDRMVDRLLLDPRYGERMAADWMDVARYADSDGYLDDKHRDFTPWRDWVIDAFNKNMPYDQFGTWQLAGDLLPDATQESILATAFNRLHRKNSEAGIVFEEYRVEYVADRAHTFGKAFLGLTNECARCHDHKYDPISQKEYYELFAFFNSTDEIGTAVYGPDQVAGPSLLMTTEDQEEIIDFLSGKINQHEKALERAAEELVTAPASDLTKVVNLNSVRDRVAQKTVAHYTLDDVQPGGEKSIIRNAVNRARKATVYQPIVGEGVSGKAFYTEDYNHVILDDKEGWYERTEPFSVSIWVRPTEIHDDAGIFSHCEDLRLGYKGYSMHLKDNRVRFIMAHSWPNNSIEVVSEGAIKANEWSQITMTYDGSSRADGVRIYINGEPEELEVITDHLTKGILYEWNIHTYGFKSFQFGYRDKIKTMKGGGLDEVKIFKGQLTDLEVLCNFDATKAGELIQNGDEHKEALVQQYLFDADKQYASEKKELYFWRDSLNNLVNGIQQIMVMGDTKEPRATHILERGLYSAVGAEVFPAVPEVIAPSFEDYPKDRLGLTQWLFSTENPLTSRVFVNRIWQMHFGRGIVKTSEDFGAQGSLPTHPDLLDYLANYFIEEGWDIKKVHRLIMTSKTYKQSSTIDSMLLEKDPENIWLARGPSHRLTAEMIRDNALAISGLLVNRLGGQSTYPYQPEGLWDEISNKSWRYKYLQEPGEGLYRRSLYTVWKRTSPPPSMLLFDVPDRSFCTVQRKETSTPLQALALLNSPQYVEAARMLAMRMYENYTSEEDRLVGTFRSTIGRHPEHEELKLMETFYESELQTLKEGDFDVIAYLKNGEAKVDAEIDKEELAALAITAHNLLNSYEAQMKK